MLPFYTILYHLNYELRRDKSDKIYTSMHWKARNWIYKMLPFLYPPNYEILRDKSNKIYTTSMHWTLKTISERN